MEQIHTRTYVTEDGVTVVAVGTRNGIEDTKPYVEAEFVFKDGDRLFSQSRLFHCLP